MSNQPCVIRETALGLFRSALEDEMFARREVELEGEVARTSAMDAIRALRYLAAQDAAAPITLLINSGGGSVVAGLALYDTMQAIPCPVRTLCVGEASSMAAILLAGGEKGMRLALPNSRIMIHDPILMEMGGTALSVDAAARRLMDTRDRIAQLLAERTGRSVEEILEKTARDTFFTAAEAVEFGLIDGIIKTWGGEGYEA